MIKINDFLLSMISSKELIFFNDINRYLEEQDLNGVIVSPWENNIEIGVLLHNKKRCWIIIEGYNFYKKSGAEEYFKYIDKEIKDKFTGILIHKKEIEDYFMIAKRPILEFIQKHKHLEQLNSQRSRNFILHRNDLIDVVYDSRNNELVFDPKISFSNIEHDTNRKFTEQICVDLLLNFEKSKKRFIKLLSHPYDRKYAPMYTKYIDIINGDSSFYTDDDLLVMISILGRLDQEKKMGPISVRVDDKLNPNTVSQHLTVKNYIFSYVTTIKEYAHLYLLNKEEMKSIGNIAFDEKLNNPKLSSASIPLLDYNSNASDLVESSKTKKETIRIIDVAEVDLSGLDLSIGTSIVENYYQPNYIESFFEKVVMAFEKREAIPIIIDNYKDVIRELLNYAKRFKVNKNPDFIILAKIKGIMSYYNFNLVIKTVESEIYSLSKRRTYYKTVADYLINLNNLEQQKNEFYRMINIYEIHIANEISRFISSKKDNVLSEYNNDEITIVSDMHFNDIKDIYKGNFSNNFNIIAGDFYNNTYHRGGKNITDALDIVGIGVIGNHDISWVNDVSDIKKEVRTNYKKTIIKLNQAFPNVKILNNEVYYKNNVAFVGLTMVTDETFTSKETKQRTFFANADLGQIFKEEDYLTTARRLLNSIDENIPIVFITHSPFKEYGVCKNKEIGIYSDKLFKEYKNIKMYVHGHGHSYQNSQIIDGILCITNPIVNGIYRESIYSTNWNDIFNSNSING